MVTYTFFAQNTGEVNPFKKTPWTYSVNTTFTPVGTVSEGNQISAVQKYMTPDLASQ